MADNVTYLDTCLDLPVDRVLDSEEIRSMKKVVVLGVREDGSMTFCTSTADVAEVNFLLDIAKNAILDSVE